MANTGGEDSSRKKVKHPLPKYDLPYSLEATTHGRFSRGELQREEGDSSRKQTETENKNRPGTVEKKPAVPIPNNDAVRV